MLCVITGAGGAIGSMCAYEAARLKYDLLLCGNTNAEALKNVKEMLGGFDVKINTMQADLTTKAGREAVALVARSLGGADVLVNNAGIADITPFMDTDDSDTARMLSADLSAHIDLTRLLLSPMIKRKSGAIVNISSVWGITGASCEVLYSSAKAGIIGFTKSLAKELAPSNITVNCVAPGCIRSKMLDGLSQSGLCEMIPLGRLGDGLEVAKAVFFLARHGYITGQTLSVDGGMNM